MVMNHVQLRPAYYLLLYRYRICLFFFYPFAFVVVSKYEEYYTFFIFFVYIHEHCDREELSEQIKRCCCRV